MIRFKNASDLRPTNFQKPLFSVTIVSCAFPSKFWFIKIFIVSFIIRALILVMNNNSNFVHLPKWRCQLHFILSLEEVALALLQYLQVSSSKQLDLFDGCTGWKMFLQGGSRERLRYFSSCSCFWVNFWNLSLLTLLLFLPSKQYVYSSKVLRYFLPRSNLSFADKWGCIIINALTAHNHSSRFTIAVVNYHMFGWMINNCYHSNICIACGRPYNNKPIISRLI